MKRINVLVTGAIWQSQAALSALRFCHCALQQGHTITQVFFFSAAAGQANALQIPLDDEWDFVHQWRRFATLAGCGASTLWLMATLYTQVCCREDVSAAKVL